MEEEDFEIEVPDDFDEVETAYDDFLEVYDRNFGDDSAWGEVENEYNRFMKEACSVLEEQGREPDYRDQIQTKEEIQVAAHHGINNDLTTKDLYLEVSRVLLDGETWNDIRVCDHQASY